MNKKDIIIVAVLLNTGLLSALAMMAIHMEEPSFNDTIEMNQMAFETKNESMIQEEPMMIAQNTTIATDEWDSVLKDYVTASSSQTLLHDEDYLDDFEKEPAILKKPTPEKIVKEVKEVPKKAPEKEVITDKKVGKTIEITVKRGDALEKIARANGTTVEQIRGLNHLKSDRLTIGQTLLVPVDGDKAPKPVVKSEVSKPKENSSVDEVEYYVIKSGDNPWKIAKQFKVKFDDLLKMNNLDEEKARNLKIGDKIRVK